MKVIYTESALADLDEIFDFITTNYPTLVGPVQRQSTSGTRRGNRGKSRILQQMIRHSSVTAEASLRGDGA